MNYTLIKLDRRHSYHEQFAYMVEFRKRPDWAIGGSSGVLDFDRVRKWMNESWGWSQDVETRTEMVKSIAKTHPINSDLLSEINRHWAWSCRYQEYRIYMDESALSLFKLKWSQDAVA
jgi:hypothetical protein